jgi:hypothetical protein
VVRVRVCTTIAAPPFRVWEELRHLDRHVEWMDDAEAIRFLDGQQQGVGTRIECDTRVGRFRSRDVMVVTEWDPERALSVAHHGRVTGLGRMTLRRRRGGATRVCWDEQISFPWYLGGPVTGLAAWPVLRRLWRRDLANLRRVVEGGDDPAPA